MTIHRTIRFLPLIALLCGISVQAATPAASIKSKDGATMILIPAGAFTMGANDVKDDEAPVRKVTLPAFYIDTTEVTCAQYAAYVKATSATPPPYWINGEMPSGHENRPVVHVTWFDAMRYAIWAGKRLPTEAEWEKAARGTDGRKFPWGNLDDDKSRRNLDGSKTRPVGSFPNGASPYGIQDMAGNAWEWTGDWYQPYPGTKARTLAFGKKYKVMRGSGTEYFYSLNENTGRCALRGRILPYGYDEYLSFRCAKDANPSKPAYKAEEVLKEAEDQLKGSLQKPVPLAYEAEYEDYLIAGRFPIRIIGQDDQSGMVRMGFPFPTGLIKDASQVRIIGADGKPRATQQTVLTKWKDESARWVLLDFAGKKGETCQIDFRSASPSASASSPELKIQKSNGQIVMDTGAGSVIFTSQQIIKEIRNSDGKAILGPMSIELSVSGPEANSKPSALRALPAEQMDVEESGPLHGVVRLQGSLADAGGQKTPFRYDLRVHGTAGSIQSNLLLTLTHLQPRVGDTDKRTPMALVHDYSVHFTSIEAPADVVFATDRSTHKLQINEKAELVQPDYLHYAIRQNGKPVAEGTRSPGWIAVSDKQGWLVLGVRHFWQNCSKAFVVTPKEIVARLWAGPEPVEFEATLAKTHEIVLDLSDQEPKSYCLDPLRATMPPAWACGTEALGGPALPRGVESLSRFPYWEVLRETGMRDWLRDMRYGFRDFGDVRHGGETKGKNASNNLEYDVPFNFQLQFLRTSQSWYLHAAEIQARHQCDIDTDHVTGHPYKHSPNHTQWYADLAHQFVRGIVLHYWLTGERRSLEVAKHIGDHIATCAEKNDGFGNERQIGWGLYALSGIYEATRDERYLKAAGGFCDRLVTEQSPTGRFKIRYDNRMSLMNGMAMNGMMSIQTLTGDDKLATGILRLCRRTLGLYPEYACRTLHGYGWALLKTNEPCFRDVLERTWETCLEFLAPRNASRDEVHAWQFTWFAAKYQMLPLFDRIPDKMPDPASWHGQRLNGTDAELFLRNSGSDPAPILVVLTGMAKGKAELLDMSGKVIQTFALNNQDKLFQPAAFTLPAGNTPCRLKLNAPQAIAWQIHYDNRCLPTIYDPKSVYLKDLYPKAYGSIAPGTREIKVRLEAVGEGFHTATLYDPDGHVVATVEHFVDLDDKGRYEVELKASIKDTRTTGWALEINQSKVMSVSGMLPYWSCEPHQWFNPESKAK